MQPIPSSKKLPTMAANADRTENVDGSAGDPPPLEVVWHRFGDQLRRRARTRLRQYGLAGQAESMDICNDVMADLMRRYGEKSLRPDDILAYIQRAIDNQVLDTFRTLARQCRDFRRNEGIPADEMSFAVSQATPSQTAIRREVLTRVRSSLGEIDCQAVDLMLENRSWVEIGKLLDMRPDAARMRVRRALERVRREMGDLQDAPAPIVPPSSNPIRDEIES